MVLIVCLWRGHYCRGQCIDLAAEVRCVRDTLTNKLNVRYVGHNGKQTLGTLLHSLTPKATIRLQPRNYPQRSNQHDIRDRKYGQRAAASIPRRLSGRRLPHLKGLRRTTRETVAIGAYTPVPGRKHRICVCPSVPMYGQTTAGPNLLGSLTTELSGTTIHSPLSRTR